MKNKKLRCVNCGKEIKKGKYCNRKCFIENKKLNGTIHHNALDKLSNRNYCVQCGKQMDINRISAYCEECEMLIVDTYEASY